MTVRQAAFGLGANLGDPVTALRGAVGFLRGCPELEVVAVSSLYRTAPVGGPAQPDYLNAVLVARTTAPPHRLLELAHAAEAAFNRTREVRWGPRTLDVDVLAVGEVSCDGQDLQLPHPRAHLRAFVLVPWAEVDPDFTVPGHGDVATLREALPTNDLQGVERLPGGDTWWRAKAVAR